MSRWRTLRWVWGATVNLPLEQGKAPRPLSQPSATPTSTPDFGLYLHGCITQWAGLYCGAFFVPVMRARHTYIKMFSTDRSPKVANTLLNVPVL